MVSTPTRIPAPAIRNPLPTIMQAAARDLAINVMPKPVSTIPPAIADTPVTAMEKITAAMTSTTAASTARPANSSAMLTGDAQITRNARRMIFPGERFFPADVLYPVVLRFLESVRLCAWELSP